MTTGSMSGTLNSKTAAVAGSNSGTGAGTIVFTSDFLVFNGGDKSYSFALDDVVTTGATLNELASVLLERGAAQIQGWVVARTEKP